MNDSVDMLYPQVYDRHADLMDAIEEWLRYQPDGTPIQFRALKQLQFDRVPSDQQVISCLAALQSLGVICGDERTVCGAVLKQTAEYRRGVRAGRSVSKGKRSREAVDLCLSLPEDECNPIQRGLGGQVLDLRGALRDLFASARRSVVIGIPFWDPETTRLWCDVLERRLQAEVNIDVLIRGTDQVHTDALTMLYRLAEGYTGFRLWQWPSLGGLSRHRKQTFHFKAVIVDCGRRAYLGSANFTQASLRWQMELGVILSGRTAGQLSKVLNEILRYATPLGRELS